MHNKEITRIDKNRQFMKDSIDCKTKYSFWYQFERNFCQNKNNLKYFMKTMQKLDFRLLKIYIRL